MARCGVIEGPYGPPGGSGLIDFKGPPAPRPGAPWNYSRPLFSNLFLIRSRKGVFSDFSNFCAQSPPKMEPKPLQNGAPDPSPDRLFP